MELKDSLGLNLSPGAFSLEVSGPDGQAIEIDSDSALTMFFRRSLRRFEQLPEQDFILGGRDARKRRGNNFFLNFENFSGFFLDVLLSYLYDVVIEIQLKKQIMSICLFLN